MSDKAKLEALKIERMNYYSEWGNKSEMPHEADRFQKKMEQYDAKIKELEAKIRKGGKPKSKPRKKKT